MTEDLSNLNGGVDVPAASDDVSLDSLHEIEVDQSQVDDTLRRGLLPAGTYLTDPDNLGELTANLNLMDLKDDAGNVIRQRKVITLTGMARARVRLSNGNGEVESKDIEGRIRVQLSPDPEKKRNFETGEELHTMDSKTTLYAHAVKAYQNTYKESPKTIGQVVDFLRTQPVRFRMIQVGVPTKRNPTPDGEPRNHCMGIYAVRGN